MYVTKYQYLIERNNKKSILANLLQGKVLLLEEEQVEEWKKLQRNKTISKENMDLFQNSGFIFEDETQEMKLIDELIVEYNRNLEKRPALYGVCLSYNCNLQCYYCYEKGKKAAKQIDETGLQNAFKGIRELSENKSEKTYVVLFGGEPFLDENRTLLESFFHHASDYINERKQKGLESKIIIFSNGMETKQFLDLIIENKPNIETVMLTLNGNKELHDSVKRTREGIGSYDRNVELIELLLKNDISVNVRFDVNSKNVEAIPDAAKLAVEKGWDKNPLFRYYISPIKWNNGQFELNEAEIIEKYLQYNLETEGEVSQVLEFGAFRLLHNVIRMFSKMSGSKITFQYCESVRGKQYVFGSDGYMYRCLASVGKPNESFGDWNETVSLKKEKADEWDSRNALTEKKCRNCRFSFVCGGGCMLERERESFCDPGFCKQAEQVLQVYLKQLADDKNMVSYGFYYDESN